MGNSRGVNKVAMGRARGVASRPMKRTAGPSPPGGALCRWPNAWPWGWTCPRPSNKKESEMTNDVLTPIITAASPPMPPHAKDPARRNYPAPPRCHLLPRMTNAIAPARAVAGPHRAAALRADLLLQSCSPRPSCLEPSPFGFRGCPGPIQASPPPRAFLASALSFRSFRPSATPGSRTEPSRRSAVKADRTTLNMPFLALHRPSEPFIPPPPPMTDSSCQNHFARIIPSGSFCPTVLPRPYGLLRPITAYYGYPAGRCGWA